MTLILSLLLACWAWMLSVGQGVAPVDNRPVVMGPFQRKMRQLDAVATALRQSSLVPRTITHKGKTRRAEGEIEADIKACLITADSLGIPPSLNVFKQFNVIQGQAVPATATLTGIAASHGIDVWPDDDCDATKATVHVHRPAWGEGVVRTVTYTVEQAAATGALDFWFEGWVGGDNGDNSYMKKEVVGQTIEEAQAAQVPPWSKGGLKSNSAWHSYREDMLIWRALRRALKRHAPEISTMLVGFGDSPVMGYTESPAGPAPTVDTDGPAPDSPPCEDEDEDIVDAELVEDQGAEGSRPCPGVGGGQAVTTPATTAPSDGAPKKNPYAEGIHIAAGQAGVSGAVLDEIIASVTGDPSANSVTRETAPTILALIREAAAPGDGTLPLDGGT